MQNDWRKMLFEMSRERAWRIGMDFVLLAIAVGVLCAIAWQALHIGHWRHDELEYIGWGDMIYRTQSEGRWLNLLLYYPAKIFSPEFGWILDTLLLGAGVAIIFWRLGLNWCYAALVSIILLFFPGYAAQSLWPTSTLPGLAIFFGSAVLLVRDKLLWIEISRLWILPLAGIALFATMPYFYVLLLPLLLQQKAIKTWAEFLISLIPGVIWSVGLVLGYLVSILINGLRYGNYGLELQDWRKEAALQIEGGPLSVATHYFAMMFNDMALWLPVVSIIGWGLVSATVLFVWFRNGGNILSLVLKLGFLSVVMIMPYLFGMMGGIVVEFRSVVPCALAIIALPFLFTVGRNWKPVAAAALVLIGAPSALETVGDLRWFSAVAHANNLAVELAMPIGVDTNRRAVLMTGGYDTYMAGQLQAMNLARTEPVFLSSLSGEAFRIGPAFFENGYLDFEDCSSNEIDCSLLRASETPLNECNRDQRSICAESILPDGSVLFRFRAGIE